MDKGLLYISRFLVAYPLVLLGAGLYAIAGESEISFLYSAIIAVIAVIVWPFQWLKDNK